MTRREEIIRRFDPNGPGIQGNLFGLPFDVDSSTVVIIPVPWEVTVSYHTGTADGPESILKASQQIDSYIREIPEAWKLGTCMLPLPKDIKAESKKLRTQAALAVITAPHSDYFARLANNTKVLEYFKSMLMLIFGNLMKTSPTRMRRSCTTH